jgi:hypothetical protein
MPRAQLGELTFDVWQGTIKLPQAHLFTETRPGVAAFNAWNVGSWGNPFEVRTLKAVTDLLAAQDLRDIYAATIQLGGLALVLEGEIAFADYLFKVLDDSEFEYFAGKSHVAGTSFSMIVEGRWRLAAFINPEA